jgi:starch synthase
VVNIMKGALLAADSIVTVSETYAWEITRPAHGVGLDSILRGQRHRILGILNGMDVSTWDPASDPHLPVNYSPDSLADKAKCKAELRRKLGLPEAEFGVDVPLLGFIGRLDPQKGPDIIVEALSGLLALDCQVCSLHALQHCVGYSHCSTPTVRHSLCASRSVELVAVQPWLRGQGILCWRDPHGTK